MRVVIQRVSKASVCIDGQITGQIDRGLLVLLGIETRDDMTDVEWLTKKIVQLRIFDDRNGVMNLSVNEVDAGILVVSQFTLHAMVKKGNRPSYIRAARPEQAVPLYRAFVNRLEAYTGKKVPTGKFGAVMQVELINDGPVTILIDSRNKE
ncbi:MAG TPA: D-tyrosyl-tRNA(Tyr) deacylase [Bacteroidetes bacterium]|nr:D-tyrosyl-tRNA(Tyr) deacylase [Bacteroidota bacterium]